MTLDPTPASQINLILERFSYPGAAPVLADLRLSFGAGERVCLLGPSGCGKSTLLRILMGLERGGEGSVETHGKRVPLSSWAPSQDVFGLVPQAPLLFPWKTVRGNLLAAGKRGVPRADLEARVDELLAAVGLSHAARLYPWQISQGMAARVSFARALLVDSRCLLLDEPFAALDAHTRRGLQTWTSERLRAAGKPCLLVTHDVREALLLGTRILVLGWSGGDHAASPARVVAEWQNFAPTAEWEARVEAALGPGE